MSCTFWLRRKKRAAMLKKQAQVVEEPSVTAPVEEAPVEKKPAKKAVKAVDEGTN